MIINAEELYNILCKIDFSKQKNLCLIYDEINGFKLKNSISDLSLIEEELNSQVEPEEYIDIKYISNHLGISKPTVEKLLEEENITLYNINGKYKVLKSDYLAFVLNKIRRV